MCTLMAFMRRFLLLTIIAILPVLAGAQNRMPDYHTVVKKFFSLYHHDGGPDLRLRFARKKEGWYVELTNQTNYTLHSSQLFWSLQKGRYQVLENFVGADADPVQLKVNNFTNTSDWFDAIHYARCAYYGYEKWDIDIISNIGATVISNDTLLEGLAMAYAMYADRYFGTYHSIRGDSSNPLTTRLGRLELPGDERVKLAKQFLEKSASLYEQIYAHDKLYQTYVGNVTVNIFRAYFYGYLQMTMVERPQEAKWFLEKCRLPANDSVAALNLLASVDSNGILFSYDGIDTYAALYLQAKYGMRKDVSIVNVSQLHVPAYLQYLKKNNIVHFSSTTAAFGSADMDLLYYQPGAYQFNSMRASDFINGYKNWKKMAVPGRDSVRVYPAQTIYLVADRAAISAKKTRSDTLRFSLGQYLTIEEFMIFDIIASNFQSRPFHFNDQVPGYFTQYMETAGLTSRIMSYKEEINEGYLQKLKKFLRTVYQPPFKDYLNHPVNYNNYVVYHVALYSALIDESSTKKDKTTTDSLVNACFAPFAGETPYLRLLPGFAEWFYKEKYDSLADKLADTYIKSTLRFSSDPNNYQYFNKSESISNLEQLKSVLQTYGRSLKQVDEAILLLSRE